MIGGIASLLGSGASVAALRPATKPILERAPVTSTTRQA
jgi:hypothetical protein